MVDIQSEILQKYGVDISQENILKLYKIDNVDLSPQDLDVKIQDTRKRWNTSVNGSNEKAAERDRARLEKADKYEVVLKNAKLRKKLFDYYNKSFVEGASLGSGATEFAKEYFELVSTTKKIKRTDVDFFFKYYQSERKNKKAILEMLTKELKVNGLGAAGKFADEIEPEEVEGKKKDASSSALIVNLFQEATVLKIRRAVEKYEEAVQNSEVCQHYPEIRGGLYEFLDIKEMDNAKQFTEKMSAKRQEVYAIRQEKGTEYVPLVDMYNILQGIGDYQDVVDNFVEFKLLLKYPNLTPYMFSFVEMKPSTIKGLVKVAKKDYAFRDDSDFILNYYKHVHDNFGISDSGIGNIIRNAEKKAKQNKVLNEVDEKLGRNKNKRKVSVGADIIHWLVYWPIFATYFVFEVSKSIFTELRKLAIPVFAIIFGLENWLFPQFGIDSLFVLRKVISKTQWILYLNDTIGETLNPIARVLMSILVIGKLLAIYILPPLFATFFVIEFADDFNKQFDWTGIERTFQRIFQTIRIKTERQYLAQRQVFVRNGVFKAFLNVLYITIVFAIVLLGQIGLKKLSDATGYFQKEQQIAEFYDSIEENNLPVGEIMIITESTANVRSGPGTDYSVVTTAVQGTEFMATGNQELTSNGKIWYEIYLNDDMSETGWASQKVIDYK